MLCHSSRCLSFAFNSRSCLSSSELCFLYAENSYSKERSTLIITILVLIHRVTTTVKSLPLTLSTLSVLPRASSSSFLSLVTCESLDTSSALPLKENTTISSTVSNWACSNMYWHYSLVNTRPHQLYWGNQEMETAISWSVVAFVWLSHVSCLHKQDGPWQYRLAANLKSSLSFCALFSAWDKLDCISERWHSLTCEASQIHSRKVVGRWGRREREKEGRRRLSSQKLGTFISFSHCLQHSSSCSFSRLSLMTSSFLLSRECLNSWPVCSAAIYNRKQYQYPCVIIVNLIYQIGSLRLYQ